MKDKGYPPTTLYEWIDALLKIRAKYKHDIDVSFSVINHMKEEVTPAVHHITHTSSKSVTIIVEETTD